MLTLNHLINGLVVILMTGFWLVGFVILYHLSRFGVGTLPKKLAALFLVGSLILSLWCVLSYYNLDLNKLTL